MLLWIEGFEGFGTSVGSAPSPSGIMARKYSQVDTESAIDIEAGRFSGYSAQLVSTNQQIYAPNLTVDSTVTIGVAVKFTFFGSGHTFILLYDGATLGMNVRSQAAGELEVRLGTSSYATTSGLGLNTGIWYYIEFQVTCNNTTGSYELRVNGTTVLSDSGIDTQPGANAYHTRFSLNGGVMQPYFDDLYFLDSTGSQNTDFLGNSRVEAIYPDGDSGTIEWTPSTGNTNYNLIDEATCDDDTEYVEDSTTNHTDLYDYGALQDITGSIFGLQINTQARITDASPYSLITPCHSGSTDSDNSAQSLSASYTAIRRIMELDPDTAAAWISSGVDAAQFGVKVG